MRRVSVLGCLVVACGAMVGCGSGSQPGAGAPPESQTAMEVAGLIRAYSGENGKGPQKAADLKKYELGYPLGLAAVQSGQIVVLWGGTVAGEGGGGGKEEVVAHEKDVPTAGGYVVLQNGQVRKMTAAEFANAPKAGKK